MHAKGGAVATFVAEILHVEDLAGLGYLERLLTDHGQCPVATGQHRQPPAPRLDVVGVVGPVGADLDALVAEGGALQAAGRLGAGGCLGQRLLDAGKTFALRHGQHLWLVLKNLARPHLLDREDIFLRQLG